MAQNEQQQKKTASKPIQTFQIANLCYRISQNENFSMRLRLRTKKRPDTVAMYWIVKDQIYKGLIIRIKFPRSGRDFDLQKKSICKETIGEIYRNCCVNNTTRKTIRIIQIYGTLTKLDIDD